MEFFSSKTKIDFMRMRKWGYAASVVMILTAIALVAGRGLNLGLDFTGGTLIEVAYTEAPDLDAVRATLGAAGYGDAVVQNFGSAREVMIRIPPREALSSAELSTQVFAELDGAEMRRVEFVGPQIGDELAEDAGLAGIYALLGILVYVLLRFDYRLSLAAVAATVHDAIITVGVVAVLDLTFDVTAVAGILAVIGYSINDTIVVFDRLREAFRKYRKLTPAEVVNVAVNETLSRTIMTAVTTGLTVLALLVFGGEVMKSFATILLIGIVVGVFSTIFVAAPFALALGLRKEHLMPVAKEGAEAESRP